MADEPKELFDPFMGGEPIEDDTPETLDFGDEPTEGDDLEDDALPEPVSEPEPEPESEVEEPDEQPTDAAETSAESDETPEPAEATEAEADEDTKPDIRIPKARFDQERKRRQQLERELRDLKRSKNEVDTDTVTFKGEAVDVSAKAKDAFTKVLYGDMEEGIRLFNEAINEASDRKTEALYKQMRKELVEETTNVVQQRSLAQRVDDIVDQYKDTYEVFDESSENFDQDLVDDALIFQRGAIERGVSPDIALEEGLQKALRLHHPELLEPTVEETPKPNAKPQARVTPEQVAQKQALAAKQPRPIASRGRSGKEADAIPDVSRMSEAEFTKLQEEELARLRGDYL